MAEKKPNGGAGKIKAPLIIPRNACQLAETRRNAWEIELPAGTAPEALADEPDALGPLARELRPKDLIYAQPIDGAWLAVYRVIHATPIRAQLALLQHFKLPTFVDDDASADPPGYRIRRNDELGWHAIRQSDEVVMGSQRDYPNLQTRESWRRFVLDHPTHRGG